MCNSVYTLIKMPVWFLYKKKTDFEIQYYCIVFVHHMVTFFVKIFLTLYNGPFEPFYLYDALLLLKYIFGFN